MIFVDTSAFLAIENRRDAHHADALEFRDEYLKAGKILITNDYVLDESYTIIRLRAGHNVAVQFGDTVRTSKLLRIQYVTPEIIESAWGIFKTFADHNFSFTDCVSFAFMRRLSIDTAFAFDKHFREYGQFVVRP